MVADFGQKKVNEQLLFHGTQSRHVDAICKEGFDWRMCGTNGTAYGQGGWCLQNISAWNCPLLEGSFAGEAEKNKLSLMIKILYVFKMGVSVLCRF